MKSQLNAAVERTVLAVNRLSFSDSTTYAQWLAQAYYFVRHSVPLLKVSHECSKHDPAYYKRSGEHIAEEKGHEKMLLNDLRTLGFKIDSFPELHSTQALYQAQYYWLEHVSHLSLLGYIVILEGLAVHVGQKKYNEISNKKAGSFLKLHVEEDTDHLQKAFDQILSLEEKSRTIVVHNAELTAYLYEQMVDEMLMLNRISKASGL
jgi:pyrroloquinoline quinone (PQQ) biosynthesis protein C